MDHYFQNCLTLDDKIFWEIAKQAQGNVGEKPFSLCVLGECGQGKSTLLTKISQIFKNFFAKGSDPAPEFKASKSIRTVTQHCTKVDYEIMTLIDTPGLNDPNRLRTDKQIFMDLVATIRQPLFSQE